MKCPSCGLSVADNVNFCPQCGRAVKDTQGVASDIEDVEQSSYYMAPPPDEGPEQNLWDEYPSMRTAIPAIAFWVLAGFVAIVVVQVTPLGFSGVIQLAISVLVIVAVLGMLCHHFIRLHSIKYRLSSQRIFVTYGLLNKRTDEIELEKYKDIYVNQDFWDKIVGCGDIEIITSDTTNPTVKIIDVKDPVAKKESIRAAARQRKSVLGITRREEL